MGLISRYIPQRWQNRIGFISQLLSFIVSALFIATAIIDYGFSLDSSEMAYIDKVYRFVRLFFAALFTLRIFTNWSHIRRQNLIFTTILGILLYLAVIPHLIPANSSYALLAKYYHIFESKLYTLTVMGIFALMEISRSIVGITRRRTNPALLLASAFLIIIFFGTILLMVPRSTLPNVSLSLVDALFVSTSSVCVTGLSTVDVASTFSTEGIIIIALLIQIGGLGVMTVTSFFALFFMGGTGLYDQFALRDMVQSDTISSLMSTLLYILGFTLGIEAIGAVLIWLSIHGELNMTINQEILFSIFHAVSAFCNAGFSTLEGNLGNPMLMTGHNSFYIIIATLIFLGGIGFPVLVNFRNALSYYIKYAFVKIFRKGKTPAKYTHLARLNTKIALITTLILLVLGTLAMAVTEWNGAFGQMNSAGKLTHSFFNAVAPRTAGFNSFELSQFSLLSLIFYSLLMWIGGASQSTAGGIKVNTLTVAFASFMSVVRGQKRVTMFNREISENSIRRAYATIFGSVMVIIGCFIVLMILEPQIDPFAIFFETISALSTAGASFGITAELSATSKVLVSTMMFIGRVGLITVMMSLFSVKDNIHYRLPEENVIIN